LDFDVHEPSVGQQAVIFTFGIYQAVVIDVQVDKILPNEI
jgi:hypothetical protein